MGGKTAQSTQQVSIPPEVLAQYASVNAAANKTAQTPFQTYGGEFVAPVDSTQQTGIAGTTAAANEAQPGYTSAQNTLGTTQNNTTGVNNAALGLAGASAGAVNPTDLDASAINKYMSPYLGDVLNSTDALANQNNNIAQSGNLGTAISSGAFGGDRTGIAAANLNQQNQLALNSTNANILNTGYNNALSTAQQQQGVGLAAGQANRAALASAGSEIAGIGQTAYGEGANTAAEEGSLASGAQTAALQGANAEIAAGTVQQQTQQAQDTAEYNQFLQQQSYPFQVDQFLANIAEGTGALSGSTTTTQQPGGFFSDKRLKHDIKKIGETFDHQDIYSYKMHGDDRTHIGLIAQKVEKKHPKAVGVDPGTGYKIVDYGSATEKAANRGHFYEGGVVPFRKARASGGPSIVDASDLSAILQAQQAMYAPMSGGVAGVYGGQGGSVPRGGSSRVPAPTGAVPHLVTAEGALRAPQTGAQNATSMLGLAKSGKGVYDDYHKPVRRTTTTTTPGGVAPSDAASYGPPTPVPPESITDEYVPEARGGVAGRRGYDDGGDVDFSGLVNAHGAMYGNDSQRKGVDIPAQNSGNQLAVASGTPAPASSGSSNLNTGLGVAQKGYQAYKHFSGPSAPNSAPVDMSDSALSATAPATDSSTVSGLASTAPVAAPAADAAATSAAAGAGSGAAAGAAGDAAAGAAAADAGGTAAAEAAAAIAAEYAAADVGAVALLAARRGGRIKRDAGGGMPYSEDDGQLDIPDTRSADKVQTAGPLVKQPTGLQTLMTMGNPNNAGTMAGDMFSNQALARGGIAGRRKFDDGGDVAMDSDEDADAPAATGVAAQPLKMDSGPSWWDRNKGKILPIAQGIAAMGTAPTKHLGVALAAGLGAGANAYVPDNQGLANTRQTEADTQGINIQNQISQMKADAAKDYLTGTSSSPPPKNAQTAATNIADQYRQKYFVQPYTPDEQSNIQKAMKSSMVLGDAPVKAALAARDQRIANETANNKNSAQQEADGLYDQAAAGDQQAAIKYNAVHQWTGDTYADQAGVVRNTRTNQPPIGVARQTLSPMQAFEVWKEQAAPTNYGAPASVPFAVWAKQNNIPIPTGWTPPSNAGPGGVSSTGAAPTTFPGAATTAAPEKTPSRSVTTTVASPAPGQPDFSDAPQKPSWLADPHHVMTDEEKPVASAYAAKEVALRNEANALPNTQRELIKAQRVLNILPNAKTGPGTDTMSAVQTALGNMTGSQFSSWLDSNPSAHALLQKTLGKNALDTTLQDLRNDGAQVRLGQQESKLIIGTLSASTEMPKDAIKSLLQWQIQDGKYEAARQSSIPSYLSQGRDATLFDNYYATKNPMANSLSTGAPAGTTLKIMPPPDKLQAYATTHFGGDTVKAQQYLKSQGYK